MGWIADLLKEIPSAARYKSELEAMEKENAALKSKVSILEAEDVNLRQEIQRRDDVIQKEKFHTNLQEIEEKILVSLANKERITESQIAQSISTGVEVAKFHLHEMFQKKLITNILSMSGSPTLWLLAQEGRKHLVVNKLIA